MAIPTPLPLVKGFLVVSAPVHPLTKPVMNYITKKTHEGLALTTAIQLCSLARSLKINNRLCRGSLPGKGHGRFSFNDKVIIMTDVKQFYLNEFLKVRGQLKIDLEIKLWAITWHTVHTFNLY